MLPSDVDLRKLTPCILSDSSREFLIRLRSGLEEVLHVQLDYAGVRQC